LQDYDDALNRIHFKAEGDVEFKALLFIPKRAPYDFYDQVQVRQMEHSRLAC
jgi:HSP90 family molecular chaperone